MLENQIIILAAGNGKRMKSELPKVMHKVGGKPMLQRVIENCSAITKDIILVYSDHLFPYLSSFDHGCKLVKQDNPLGTAYAVSVAKDLIDPNKVNSVIYADNPLITPSIIQGLISYRQLTGSALVTLAFERTNPNQYGRILVDDKGNFIKIVEFKFATEQEKQITLCNSGIMAFAPGILAKYLPECLRPAPEVAGKELYLTDIVRVCYLAGEKVSYYQPDNHELVIGVNTPEELMHANEIASK